MATDVHGAVATAAAVRVTGLTRSFDGRAVIDGLDLTLRAGEFTVLLGRSGCGKSTLLRILAGLDREIEGDVLVPERRAVAFQAPRLMPWKRVWRNVLLGLPGRPSASAPSGHWPRSGWNTVRTPGPRRCPAARPSGPHWPGRWCANRICCCWTNRSARSTR